MRGEIAFAPALRERVALLKGLPTDVVEKVLATRIAITPGAHDAGRHHARRRRPAALVSGGFTAFVEPVARADRLRRDARQHAARRSRRASPAASRSRSSGAEAKEAALTELAGAARASAGGDARRRRRRQRCGDGPARRARRRLSAPSRRCAPSADAAIDHADLTGAPLPAGLPPRGVRRRLAPGAGATARPRSAATRSGACCRRRRRAASPCGGLPTSAPRCGRPRLPAS